MKGHVLFHKYSGLCGPCSLCHSYLFCLCSSKAASDVVQMNGCGWVPIKLYLHKQVVGWDLVRGPQFANL